MLSRTVLPVLAALGLTLGACTDEPSEAALRQAVERSMMASYEREVEQARKLGVRPDDKPVITAFSKLVCKPAEPKPGHLCTIGGAANGKVQEQGTARFVRAADGTLTMAEWEPRRSHRHRSPRRGRVGLIGEPDRIIRPSDPLSRTDDP